MKAHSSPKSRALRQALALCLAGGLLICLPAASAIAQDVSQDSFSAPASMAAPAASGQGASSATSSGQGNAAAKSPPPISTTVGERVLALLISTGAIAVFALLVSWAAGLRPWAFIIGADGRVSNSKTQLVTWSCVLGTVYLATVGLRVAHLGLGFVGHVGITEHLLALSGLSALTYGGAKAITLKKIDDSNQPAANGPGGGPPRPQKTQAARANFSDLVTNDKGQADLGDFQMIVITAIAAAAFLLSAFHFLGQLPADINVTLPDIDSTLLTALGAGQGAYLFKKGASNLGDG